MTDFLIFGLSATLVSDLGMVGMIPFFLISFIVGYLMFNKNRNKK